MLVSLLALAEVLGTNSWQPFSTGETTAEAVSPHLRPEDPTTLTLALIGAATLAVYFAVRRSTRDRGAMLVETVEAATPLPETAAAAAAARTDVEQPSRGAA